MQLSYTNQKQKKDSKSTHRHSLYLKVLILLLGSMKTLDILVSYIEGCFYFRIKLHTLQVSCEPKFSV
jgi:hypothetical protein